MLHHGVIGSERILDPPLFSSTPSPFLCHDISSLCSDLFRWVLLPKCSHVLATWKPSWPSCLPGFEEGRGGGAEPDARANWEVLMELVQRRHSLLTTPGTHPASPPYILEDSCKSSVFFHAVAFLWFILCYISPSQIRWIWPGLSQRICDKWHWVEYEQRNSQKCYHRKSLILFYYIKYPCFKF